MSVVDASVVVAALADTGPDATWAEGVLAAGNLSAPDLVIVESADILRRLELAGALPPADAAAAHEDLLRLRMTLYPYATLSARVWQLRRTVTCYDGCYVALAERLGQPLATLDAKLAGAPGPTCAFLRPPP